MEYDVLIVGGGPAGKVKYDFTKVDELKVWLLP